jgi:hypothetical protein
MKRNITKYGIYITAVLFFCVAVLILNQSNQIELPQVLQDINAGVIAATLTSLISLILFKVQSENEENATKKSVIYEEKIKTFKNFIEILGTALEDGTLNATELRSIIWNYFLVRMVIEDPHHQIQLDKIMQEMNSSLINVDKNTIPDYAVLANLFNNICAVFKAELYHSNDKTPESLSFANFSEISLSQTSASRPFNCKSFEEFSALLRETGNFKTVVSGQVYSYILDDAIISTFEKTYLFIDHIISGIDDVNIRKEFQIRLNEAHGSSEVSQGRITFKNLTTNKEILIFLSSKQRIAIDEKIIADGKRVWISSIYPQDSDKLDRVINIQTIKDKIQSAI